MELHCVNLALLLPDLHPAVEGTSSEGRTDAIAQRDSEESLGYQDMLARAPVKAPLLAQARGWVGVAVCRLAGHHSVSARRVIPAVTNGTVTR